MFDPPFSLHSHIYFTVSWFVRTGELKMSWISLSIRLCLFFFDIKREREKVRREKNRSNFDRLVYLRKHDRRVSFIYWRNVELSGAISPLFSLFSLFFPRSLARSLARLLSHCNKYFRFWFIFGGKGWGWNGRITIEEQ